MTSVNWHLYPNEKPEKEKDYLVFVSGEGDYCPYSELDCDGKICESCIHYSDKCYQEMRVCMYHGEWDSLDEYIGEKVLAWTELPSPPDLEK